MEFHSIKVEDKGRGIGIITLNCPEKRNAISIQMRREISYCLNEWKDSSINVVIFTGADSAFSAGFDLDEFGHPEIKFGVPLLFTPLRWIVGDGLARDLCLTGRKIDAKEAYRIGLVNEIVEEAELLERAIQIGMTILEAPLETIQFTKKYLVDNAGQRFEEAFLIEHDKAFREILLKRAREKE